MVVHRRIAHTHFQDAHGKSAAKWQEWVSTGIGARYKDTGNEKLERSLSNRRRESYTRTQTTRTLQDLYATHYKRAKVLLMRRDPAGETGDRKENGKR